MLISNNIYIQVQVISLQSNKQLMSQGDLISVKFYLSCSRLSIGMALVWSLFFGVPNTELVSSWLLTLRLKVTGEKTYIVI